eukprot:6491464-Amphidinium_carterae.1
MSVSATDEHQASVSHDSNSRLVLDDAFARFDLADALMWSSKTRPNCSDHSLQRPFISRRATICGCASLLVA